MESLTLGQLSEALSKAQGAMESAKKDSINPHFKSKYADVAAVIEAIREPLSKNGLSYVQYLEETEKGLGLVTKLMHTSGEWISGSLPLIMSKNDMQGLGSALTYARRYSLSAMVGIAQDDDDGNEAVKKVIPAAPLPREIAESKRLFGLKIKTLKQELQIEDEDLKAQAFRLCGKDDSRLMNLEDLQKIVHSLEEEKSAREKAFPTIPEIDQTWLKEIP